MDQDTPLHHALQALIAVARHHGVELAEPALRHHYNLEGATLPVATMARIFVENQFRTRRRRLGWKAVIGLGEAYPALLRLRDGRTLVVAGCRPHPQRAGQHELALLDPARSAEGFFFVDADGFDALAPDETLLVKRAFTRAQEQRPFNLGWFLWHFWRERGAFAHIMVAALLLIGLGLATPLFFQLVIDKVLVHNSATTLMVLGVGVLGVVAFEALLGFLRTWLLLHAANRMDIHLAGRTFTHLMSLPLFFFENSASGVLAKHMQQTETIREFLSGRLFLTVLDSFALVIFLPILLGYSLVLGSVVLGFSALVALAILLVMPPFNRALRELYRAEGDRQAMLVETIHGMRTVKSLALEPRQNRRWADQTARAIACRFEVGQIGNVARSVISLSDKLLTVAIVWIGALMVFDGKLTVGELVAIQMLAGRVSQPLAQLAGLANEFQQTSLSVAMLGEIMNRRPERQPGATLLRPRIEGALRCEGVSFSYPLAPAPALADLTLDIPAGSRIGIVGRSGSGKSTFTRLLQGLYVPTQGHIRLDGVDLREIDLAHLRRHIGVVLQENVLFAGSIRENIAATMPSASFAEIVAAAQVAGADAFVRELPQGYDTILEEGASNLSGGQRQRLAIARALLPQPPILIFDEATSALDPESEAIVQENLSAIAEGRTFIAVSHRLTTLVDCDRIFVFDRGRVAQAGTHRELLQASPLYRHLWEQQTRHLEAAR